MASVHFVEDYERHVADLVAAHPLDEAMSLAVGGRYDELGGVTVDILTNLGMHEGASLVDLGCGSGRVAKHLGLRFPTISYVGLDIVQTLLDYAQKQCPSHFRFVKHQDVVLPLESASADFFIAFSVFTHLLHEESYLYMFEANRVLKPGGKLIFSFLEFGAPHHWHIFQGTADTRRHHTRYHMNSFIERSAIYLWAARLGLNVLSLGECPLGQSLAVLETRSPLPHGFDPTRYLDLNPDVKAAEDDPAQHWLVHGYHEKREWR